MTHEIDPGDDPPLPLPVTPSQAPLYYLMSEHFRRFERLTRALLAGETHLQNVELFGVGGQDQYGVDVTADRRDGSGREVASCKCVRTVTPAEIKAWSDDFLSVRAERWPDVRRFVLATAAENITALKILDQRAAEAARFAALDIEYEVWGPEQLTERLGLAPRSVAQRMLGNVWADELHGRDAVAELSAVQTAQIHRLQAVVSEQIENRLEAAWDRLRSGDHAATAKMVAEAKSSAVWPQLRPQTQAAVLRLEGNLEVAKHNLAAAKALALKAESLDPSENRLLAMIASDEEDADAALAILGTPSSRSGRQLLVALLIQADQLDAAATEIEAIVAEDADDAESQRLLALVRLFQDRREEGYEAAMRAEALAPRWLSVTRVAAIARYTQAVSPLIEPIYAHHPNPIEAIFVRGDETSNALLREALSRFERLLTTRNALDVDRLWKLACLVNLPDREADALAWASQMLMEAPEDVGAIAWSLVRNLKVDLGPSRQALAERYAAGAPDEFMVRAYAQALLKDGGPEAVRQALTTGIGMQQAEAKAEAHRWLARIEDTEDAPPADEGLAATDALRETLGIPRPQPMGLRFAMSAAQSGELVALAPYVAALEKFDTEAAINIVLFVLHRTAPAAEVLAFFERHRERFQTWARQPAVRRVIIRATFEDRRVPAALRMAEQLAAETGEIEDRLDLANLHIASGHAQAALPAIRLALEGNSLDAATAIRLSIAVTREDRSLSQNLWRRAFALGIPDKLVVAAFGHAYRIGLDEEANGLMPRLHARAASGASDIWIVDVADIGEHLRAFQQRDRDIGELYELGAIPIHLAAGALNIKLADFYWLEGRASARGPLRPLLIRHGGRPLELAAEHPWRKWIIHLDITGLLMADQLGLLGALREVESTIRVSRSLPEALFSLEQDVTHQQAIRLDAARAITKAQLGRRLAIQELPAGEDATVRHQRLRRDGDEPGPTIETVFSVLAGLGAAKPGVAAGYVDDGLDTVPSLGARLVFPENAIETLAMRGGLDAALQRFRCEIPQDVLDELSEAIVRAEAGETLADRIRALRLHVAGELESGRFEFVEEAIAPEAEADASSDDAGLSEADDETVVVSRRSPLERGLIDLLGAPGAPGGVLWCDDRNLSGYVHAGKNLIVGVVEVLNALVSEGLISEADRRAKLLMLRRGGGAFIPLRIDEILSPLAEAPVDPSAGVIETRDLATLRRNLSAAASLDPRMKIGQPAHPSLEGRPEELPFLVSSWQILKEAIYAVWQHPHAEIGICEARSDWLWANLRLQHTLRPLHEDADLLASLIVASLFVAITHLVFPGGKQRQIERRRALSAWITRTAIKPREEAGDERFLDAVAKQIGDLVAGTEGRADEISAPEEAIRDYLESLRRIQYALVPESLQERLLERPDFAAAAGAIPMVTVAGQRFDARAFWPACVRALRQGRARTRIYEGSTVTLVVDDECLAMSGGVTGRVEHPIFAALKAKGAERREAIEHYLASLDLAPEDHAALTRQAIAARNDVDLATLLDDAPDRSVIAHYGRLDALLSVRRARANVDSFLPPPAARLMHHLRLRDANGTVTQRAAEAWSTLRSVFGPGEAFLRLGGLPVPMATVIGEDLRAADLALNDLGAAASPVMRLHRAAVARRSDGGSEEAEIETLIEGLEGESALFARLLTWSEMAFQSDPIWRGLSTGEQAALVWFHAHRVVATMVATSIDPRPAAEFFQTHPPQRTLAGLLSLQTGLRGDCASPAAASAEGVLYHGLAYIFGEQAPKSALPNLAERLEAFTKVSQESELPQLGLLTRSDDATNEMGSFLDLRPAGLPQSIDLADARAAQIANVLDALTTSPADRLAWAYLHALGAPQLSTEQRDRLDAAFARLDFKDVFDPAQDYIASPLIAVTRKLLGGPLDDDILPQKLADLARHFAFRYPGGFNAGDGSPASVAFGEIIELAAAIARQPNSAEAITSMARNSQIVASFWPAAAAPLRDVLDRYIRRTPREDAKALWEGFLTLRRWA